MPAYDAFLLLSFGGPEGPDDVLPFLENVTRGRGVPAGAAGRGGRALPRRRRREPDQRPVPRAARGGRRRVRGGGLDLPLYWGNRNWHPFLDDTVRQMARRRGAARDRVRHLRLQLLLGLPPVPATTSTARSPPVGPGAPGIDKIRPYFNHPGFIEPFAASAAAALALAARRGPGAAPGWCSPRTASRSGMAAASGSVSRRHARSPVRAGGRYAAELREASRLDHRTGARLAPSRFDLVFQSRSGPPSVPWLEPDVNDHLAALAKGTLPTGRRCRRPPSGVVVVPVGLRQRPHGGRARPGRGGGRDGGVARPAVRPGEGARVRPRGSPRWSPSWSPSGREGAPALGPGRPRPRRLRRRGAQLPGRLLPLRPPPSRPAARRRP